MITQAQIIEDLDITVGFDAAQETYRRISFLKNYLTTTGLQTYVLGISGGVDSLTAGLMVQRAVRELRTASYSAEFVAVRLPYGEQADESDARMAIAAIDPDRIISVNIKAPTDVMMAQLKAGGFAPRDRAQEDFLLGNIKARQRMVAQYAVAGGLRGLVIGTDHAAEALMGFFTKFGDGAADILPLAGLNKRRVRAIATHLGAPKELVFKVPTADLETDAPLRPDEDAYGVTYDQIDDFLEGKLIDDTAHARILKAYQSTSHKRALPITADTSVENPN